MQRPRFTPNMSTCAHAAATAVRLCYGERAAMRVQHVRFECTASALMDRTTGASSLWLTRPPDMHVTPSRQHTVPGRGASTWRRPVRTHLIAAVDDATECGKTLLESALVTL